MAKPWQAYCSLINSTWDHHKNGGDFDANVGVVHPDAEGRFAFALPEGKYSVNFTDIGRADVPQTVEVKAGTPAKLDAAMAIEARGLVRLASPPHTAVSRSSSLAATIRAG